MRNILFIRHPKPVGRESNSPLTVAGIEQAALTGRALGRRGGRIGLSTSPAPRALTAAQAIAAEIGLPKITIDFQLGERTDKQAGMSMKAHQEEWELSFRDRSFVPPHGMSVEQAASQHFTVLNRLRQSSSEGSVAVVGHAGNLAALLGDERYMKDVPDRIRRLPETGVDGLVDAIPPASITEIAMEAGKFYVVGELGSTEHLREIASERNGGTLRGWKR